MTLNLRSRSSRLSLRPGSFARWIPLLLIAGLPACSMIGNDASGPQGNLSSDGSDHAAKGGGGMVAPDKSSKKKGSPGEMGSTGDAGDKEKEKSSTDASGSSSTDTGSDSSDSTKPECDVMSPVSLYLSPDDSNSMSSPSQVKQRLLVDKRNEIYDVAVRPWEFFNYYDFPYPAPASGLAGVLELRPASATPGHYKLQIGVSSENWNYETRPAMNLTWVLDTSGSMDGPPLAMLKASVRAVSSKLRAGDRVSIVTWNTEQLVLLDSHTVAGANDPKILEVINGLQSGGGTDLQAGLVRGYALARKNYLSGGAINRVMLVSDGGANVGETSAELIAKESKDSDQDGIYLAGIGVGLPSTYHDQLMDTVTDLGKGASLFVGNEAEASRLLGDHLMSVLGIAARNVQVQIELPPGYEMVTFSGEEASSDPSKVEPQHLAPNDSMVFHQEFKNCAPESVDVNAKVKVTVRYVDAKTRQPQTMVLESTFAELAAAPLVGLDKGEAIMAFTEALKAKKENHQAMDKINAAQAKIDAALARRDDAELREMKQALGVLRGN